MTTSPKRPFLPLALVGVWLRLQGWPDLRPRVRWLEINFFLTGESRFVEESRDPAWGVVWQPSAASL